MSTRATITVADDRESFDLYQHHDGYPEGPYGLVRHIAMARRLAWDLPRFEAADFSAAVIAVLKDRGGSTYLTKNASEHADRAYHYRIEPVRENTVTRVMLTISRASLDRGQNDVEIFSGEIQSAVSQFNAFADASEQPREWRVLGDIEAALYRAEEEIGLLCGHKPDEDTEKALEDIDDASRASCLLRHHLEQNDPWRTLGRTEQTLHRLRETGELIQPAALPAVEVKLAMDAHRRFQRDL
ncbi:hypothetical protein EGN72_07130 [Pseudorhodobacter sp. E13]|uniref:hypothetical protein n=1 Tax=Pseudorhodobacter sp. E13 TaxID=2487931 RepID=UPI000F8D6F7D|nr:hypothetical protein [Pseudorhodobacter sp. E13]RUS60940.1 hypothetical protein EGN72_07130 [Pseudorhodobacter sp. E13]